MAKTYVGYVKREVANEIDWSSIGSGISDMLLAERDARETKKKEIDDASREFSKVLTEAEGSGHTGINQFFLDGANSIQEVRLMQDRLLRSGQLRLKDYNIQRQNAIDGTNEMLALVKGYDTKYKEKMERLQSGVSAAQEQYLMEQIEGFSNFQNHRLYVNPTNGQFSVGKTVAGKGGINELSKNPNDFSTMQALKNRLNIKIDKYDWNKNVQQGVDNLAKIVLAKNASGVKTREDARQSTEYKDAKANWIDSMMTDSTNVGSMLTDWIGGYSFTQNRGEAATDNSKILLVPDPRQPSSGNLVPELGSLQEKEVRKRLEQEFESRVDKVETAMPFQRKSPYDQKSEQQAVIDKQGVEAWAGLYFGTPEEQKGFADRLLGSPNSRRQGLVEIDTRTKPGTFILKYKDKTKNREIDVLDDEGNALPYGDYIALGNEIHGIDDYGRALELSGRKDATYSTERGGRARRKGSRKAYNSVDNQVNYRGEKINADNIIEEKIEENVADEEAINVIKDVFEIQDLPTPNIEVEPGGKEISPSSTRVIPGASVPGYTPAVITKPSIKISVPGVTDAPIYIPEGEGMKEVLDKAIALIDEAYDNNTLLTPEDFKAIFPTENIFLEYNTKQPDAEESAKSEESSGTGKKQLPGKKQ